MLHSNTKFRPILPNACNAQSRQVEIRFLLPDD